MYYSDIMKWKEVYHDQLKDVMSAFSEFIGRIEQKKTQLDDLRPLPAMVVHKLREQLNIEWSYNSNAIEGNTLTLSETRMVLEEGITIKGKSFKEHLEVSNHHDAIEYVEQLSVNDNPITATDIRSVHALVMQKIDKEYAGKYRTGAVRITGASFVPPEASDVPILITELMDYIATNPENLPDIVLAVMLHHRFVWVHPFFDGNGRSGRLLLNLFLLRKGFPPAVLLKDDRKKYYDALKKADKGDISKLCLLIFQSIERSLDIYLSSISSNFGYYKPIEDIVEETSIPYNHEYVSLLARRGKINAYKDQGKWFTTKEAVTDYIANRKRNRTGLKHA